MSQDLDSSASEPSDPTVWTRIDAIAKRIGLWSGALLALGAVLMQLLPYLRFVPAVVACIGSLVCAFFLRKNKTLLSIPDRFRCLHGAVFCLGMGIYSVVEMTFDFTGANSDLAVAEVDEYAAGMESGLSWMIVTGIWIMAAILWAGLAIPREPASALSDPVNSEASGGTSSPGDGPRFKDGASV